MLLGVEYQFVKYYSILNYYFIIMYFYSILITKFK